MHRQTPQVIQRGIPCTKVVQGQENAYLFEQQQFFYAVIDGLDKHVFSNFQLQLIGLDIVFGNTLLDGLNKIRRSQLPRRYIHGNAQIPVPCIFQASSKPAGFLQHIAANRMDQSALFGQRNELDG